jgi:YgiT-type zinc finger domain-containing protein
MVKRVCMACRKREVTPQVTTITFDENDSLFVFKHVPAFVCQNCGNTSLDSHVAIQLERVMNKELESGPKEEILEYASVA